MTDEPIKEAIAPCGLCCRTCFAHVDGDIRRYSMKLKEKWGKKDDIEYFWMLSRNRKKRDIMELYTITLDNRILIISGISSREKYNYFKDKLASVFNSISI